MKFLVMFVFVISSILCDNVPHFYSEMKSPLQVDDDAVGSPLFLTPLIENGQIDEAKEQAKVEFEGFSNVTSYAGYFTVNKTYNAHLYAWFFPAEEEPTNAPVVLWLQGGPGQSTFYGIFGEHGPFIITKNITLQKRQISWNTNHHMIYIDSPVGTGCSFSDDVEGFATNQFEIAQNLLNFLQQFFQLFPELRKNDFFVTGESYAGKYVPTLCNVIHESNANTSLTINLQGLAIGNGFTDPENQLDLSNYLYWLGLIDNNIKIEMESLVENIRKLIQQHKFKEALVPYSRIFDYVMYYTNYTYFYNYLKIRDTDEANRWAEWMQKAEVRKSLHAGATPYLSTNVKVFMRLQEDFLKSAAHLLPNLIDRYRVLIYSGQLDMLEAYPFIETVLSMLQWDGVGEYKKATRRQWWVGSELAGYYKTVRNLTEVLVRNAGHMVPADQPIWALDLITRFTRGKSMNEK